MSTSQPATTAAVSDTEIDSVRISESQRVIDALEAEHEHEREGDESEPFVSDAARGDDRQDEPARHGDDELAGRPVRIAVREDLVEQRHGPGSFAGEERAAEERLPGDVEIGLAVWVPHDRHTDEGRDLAR